MRILAENLTQRTMTLKRLSVGLIGVGGFGASHLKVLQQLEAEGLVVVWCVLRILMKNVLWKRGEGHVAGVRWYRDYQNLLAQEIEIEAVAIAAPIHLHFEMTTDRYCP